MDGRVSLEPLLSAGELARQLKMPIGTIYSLASKGLLPTVTIPGMSRRYLASAVAEWIRVHSHGGQK